MPNTRDLLGAMLGSGLGGRNPRMAGFGGYPGGMTGRGGMTRGLGGGLPGGAMGGVRPAGGMSGMQGALLGVLGGLAVSAVQRHFQQRTAQAAQPSPEPAPQPAIPAAAPASSPAAGATQAGPAPTSDQAAAAPDEGRAWLLVRVMIAAANADMRIDADERARILAKLEEAGAGPEERALVEREMNAPMSIDDIAGEVSGPDVAAQVYAAALAAIDVDKATERRYLQALAARLGLDAEIINEIHDQLGQPRPA
jgi:uncharacterized membrane protein YebE (DUF533 family)